MRRSQINLHLWIVSLFRSENGKAVPLSACWVRGVFLVFPCLLSLTAPLLAAETRKEILGAGTRFATPVYRIESGVDGPTVLLTGGIHGNEPSGAAAAEQIRHWPITRGILVVIPRVNVPALEANQRRIPGVDKSEGDLNRNFPKRNDKDGEPRGELAALVWEFAGKLKPDWHFDLHESTRRYCEKKGGCANTVIAHGRGDAVPLSRRVADAINETIPAEKDRFVRLTGKGDTYLATGLSGHFGTESLILETLSKGRPLSKRTREHRTLVRHALEYLEMLDKDFQGTRVTSEDREADKTIRVALYDAKGTGGKGVPSITRLLSDRAQYTLVHVGPAEMTDAVLGQFDVVVFPGGTGSGQAKAIGEGGRAAVRRFVRNGGGYVGICAGAYLCLNRFSWSLGIVDGKTVSPKWKRGKAMLEVAFTPKGTELLDPADKTIKLRYHNGPVIEPAELATLPDYRVLASFQTEVAENDTPKGVMVGAPAILAADFGKGRIVALSPHAEGGENERIVENAVRYVGGR